MGFQSTGFQNLGNWLARLVRLDLTVFDDVKDDAAATAPALTVMLVASFAAGLGSLLWWITRDFHGADSKTGEAFLKTFVLGGIFQAALWLAWVYIAAMLLSRVFGAGADLNRMLRTMGLAFAPMVITILMVIDILAVPFAVIALGATLLLSNAAIQASSDAEPRQVIMANLAGFSVFAIVLGILGTVAQVGDVGGIAPGIFFVPLNFL
jgi:predicted neutral ceramidase superfamily lipid hydrolase